MAIRIEVDGYPHAYRVGGDLVCEPCMRTLEVEDDSRHNLSVLSADSDVIDILMDRDVGDPLQCAWCGTILGRVLDKRAGVR